MKLKNWVKGAILMNVAYLIAIYIALWIQTPLIYKIALTVMFPIGFYFQMEQDYNNLKKT